MRSNDEVTTKDGEPYNPETGELIEAPKRRRGPFGRPSRTPEEQAEAERVRSERAELRRQEIEAIRSADESCEANEDAPIMWKKPARISGAPSGIRLELPRVSGRGLSGSRLAVAARSYDGAGMNGGVAHDYATLFVLFKDRAGYSRRTVGVAIHRSELVAVASALLRYADELDATEAGQT